MDEIEQLLTRGVDKVYPSKDALEKELRSGKKLKLYEGFDPTGTDLHIGHMIGLRKLAQWQKLGHEVIFLIGDTTATVGDPTGKDKTRESLSREQVLKNAQTYKEQASRILCFEGDNPVKVLYNSSWLGTMNYWDFMNLASHVSYNQIIERDMFQRRIKNKQNIGMLELIYPLLQGYDSVAMEVDLEIGGTDQMFNMMVGRDLLKKIKNKDKFVMTTPLLTDSNGIKIGKSEGNVIGLTDRPEDLFGKIMSLADDVIVKAMEYLTDIPMEEINEIEGKMKHENPITFKKRLAYEIVKQLNTESDAKRAEEAFRSVVQDKSLPTDIKVIPFKNGSTLASTATLSNLVDSNSEWKRLVSQGAVSVDGKRIENPFMKNDELPAGGILKIGNRNYAKIKKS